MIVVEVGVWDPKIRTPYEVRVPGYKSYVLCKKGAVRRE